MHIVGQTPLVQLDGVSSGANYLAARQLQARYKTVVTLLPDGFPKYRSLGLRGNTNCCHRREAAESPVKGLLDCKCVAQTCHI